MKIIVLLLLSSSFSQAQIKPHMQKFYKLTDQLYPYIIDKNSYFETANQKQISALLAEFSQQSLELKKEEMAQSDDMKFRVSQLSGDINEAETSFKTGFKDYSYWVLRSTLSNCFSCHTEKSLNATDYKFDKIKNIDKYSQADFLFLVRNYTQAVPLFESLLINYPSNKATPEDLENSLQKLLFFAVRVQTSDAESLKIFERILANKALPSSLRNNLMAWKSYLNVKKYRIEENINIQSVPELKKFIDSRTQIADHYRLLNRRAIVDLETSHFLHQLLAKNPSQNMKAWILYYLADTEKDYRTNMFDMSTDNFLKECIENYTKTPAAKKCYQLFKQIKIDSFTGSEIKILPDSVQKQLNRYQKLIDNK